MFVGRTYVKLFHSVVHFLLFLFEFFLSCSFDLIQEISGTLLVSWSRLMS